MELRVLRYFLAVSREESITRAAESLHIAQPSLSKQMIDLERELGKQLLVRGKRKVTLTKEGILLRKRAEEIILLTDKTAQEISADSETVEGEVTIGGHPLESVLCAAAHLRERYPDVHFDFYSSDATDVAERLEHGSLDFAIFMAPITNLSYNFCLLPDISQWGLLLRADSPLAQKDVIRPEDVRNEPLIFHRRAGLQQVLADWAKIEPNQFKIAATYNVVHGSPVNLVRSGLGSLMTIRDLLSKELDSDMRFLPLEPPLNIQYALVWKRHAVLSRAAECFLAEIRENSKKE